MNETRKRMQARPCPFCGSGSIMPDDRRSKSGMIVAYFMECRTCGARGPDAIAIYEACGRWNERFEQKDLPL